jgi:hypothetical protein
MDEIDRSQTSWLCGHAVEGLTLKMKNKQNWSCCEAALIDSVMYKKKKPHLKLRGH